MKNRVGLVLLLIMVSESLAGHPCAHVLICCRGAGRGITFEVNGKFIPNHCYSDIDQVRDILQKIKDVGIKTVIVDMTNPSQWLRLWSQFEPMVDNIAQVCREKQMQYFLHIGGGLSPSIKKNNNITIDHVPFWNDKAEYVWNKWAQAPEYRKYGFGDDRPILLIFRPGHMFNPNYEKAPKQEKRYLEKFRKGTMQVNGVIDDPMESDGWGYRRLWHNKSGKVRYTSPNGGVAPDTWHKIDAKQWEAELRWVKQAEEYSVYGSYDDACDSIFWGIARTANAAKTCSIYPDPSNPRYYYDVLKRVLNEDVFKEKKARLDRDALRKQWQNPPLGYRLNLNLHNFPLEAAEQDALIKQTLDDGWGGYALNVPYQHYLTDEGMRATARFVKKAKAAGMDLWLYDEQGYPSGNAGDRVIKENPAWECMGIFFNHMRAKEGDLVFEIPPGKPVLVAAFPLTHGGADYSDQTDLREHVEGSLLKWRVPAGEWLVFAATKDVLYEGFQAADKGGSKLGSRYPSLLMPEVTDAFLRSTHDVYAEYLGDDLGRYFTSTFTDEPSLMAMQFHSYAYQHALIPWKEVLSEEIAKRYGYRPEEKLIPFYFDEGPVGQQYRYQYFKTVGDLFAQNFLDKIRDWCHQHHFKSGGHLLLEETLIAQVPLYGHIMQCFRAMDAPGIDILSCYPVNMPVHSPKLAASAAALAGHHLVMSEPCPAADRAVGGEPDFVPARGHFNLLLQGGVTHFNSYLRLNKLDRAQKNELNIYVGRVGMLLRGGHTLSDIGIVYPIESLWTRFTPRYHKVAGWNAVTGATEIVHTIDKTFQDVSRFMFEQCWEYTHLDGQALIEGTPVSCAFVHAPFRFKVIILPYVSTLPAQAWANIATYIERGGKVICLGEMPLNSDRQFPDETLRSSFAELVRKNDHVVFMETWNPTTLNALLNTWLKKPLHIEDESQSLRMTHKRIKGKEVFFVINDSDKTLKTTIRFRTSEPLEEWDPTTGRVRSISNPASIVLMPYEGKIYRQN